MSKYNRESQKNNIDELSVNAGIPKQLMVKSKTTVEAPALELEKNDKSNNVATNLQQNAINGLIEGLKIVAGLFPLISGMMIASIVIVQVYYANIAEQYYHIEKKLFFTENVYENLLDVWELAIINILIFLFVISIYKNLRKSSLVFYFMIFLISCTILVTGFHAYAGIILQRIFPTDGNSYILYILKHPLVFSFLLSFLGTVGLWLRLNNIEIQTPITEIIYCVCLCSAILAIEVWLFNFIVGGVLIINRESYPQKKTYEIVQNNTYPELNTTSGQVARATNFQVVILHRGSQVLLMNGEIDGNETINLKEDMSSSNLVIDISSYEFQEASQYRFYRKTFKNVTTNAPENNDQ
jgi:hypothetical protein